MLTQRSRYALRAMLVLANEQLGQPPVPMSRIATEAQIPRKFLEIILGELRQAGFVNSTRGKAGGFHLARPSHLISFGDIIRTIEGPLALVPCVSRTAYRPCADCAEPEACTIRALMRQVRDATAAILDEASLEALRAQPALAAQ